MSPAQRISHVTSRSAAAVSSARVSRWRWRSSLSTSSLIEAHPFGTSGQPSFDDRTTALSNGSRRIFEALGVWPLLEREATPIRRIHVSDRGRFGFARLDAAEQGLSALGFVVVNRVDGRGAVASAARRARCGVLAPARVRGMQSIDGRQRIECDLGRKAARRSKRKLAIAADGARSVLREAAGIGAQTLELRADRARHQRPHAALPRSRRVRALHSDRAAGAAADVGRAVGPDLDVHRRSRAMRSRRRTTLSSSRACRTPSGSVSGASCASGRGSCIRWR